MCHKNFTFNFGDQLNFIIGYNGSAYISARRYVIFTYYATGGKSAILTGIVVGLGGKAATTGRGTGIKSLIREGQR